MLTSFWRLPSEAPKTVSAHSSARWTASERVNPRASSDRYLESQRSEGLHCLFYDNVALYQTLNAMGGPGEQKDDELALIDLVSRVATRRREQPRYACGPIPANTAEFWTLLGRATCEVYLLDPRPGAKALTLPPIGGYFSIGVKSDLSFGERHCAPPYVSPNRSPEAMMPREYRMVQIPPTIPATGREDVGTKAATSLERQPWPSSIMRTCTSRA